VSGLLAYFWIGVGDELVTIGNFLAAIRYLLTAWPTLPAASARPGRQPQPEISAQLQNPQPKEALVSIKGQLPA
jgi:hypothetical protein